MKKSILFLIVLLVSSNVYSSQLTPSEVVVDFTNAEKEYDMERFVYHFSEGTVNEFIEFFKLLYQMQEKEELEQLTGMQMEEFLEYSDIEKLVIIFEGIAESTEEFEVKDIEILSESIDGDNSTVIILRGDEEVEFLLVLENDEWKIDIQTNN